MVAECSVGFCGRTGVEMEALTGVAAALLTIYDMCKGFGKEMEISDIHLVHKEGGKSGCIIMKDRPAVVAVSGVKNSGKTTLIIEMLPYLTEKGLRVAVIKHDGHSFEPDPVCTDTGAI